MGCINSSRDEPINWCSINNRDVSENSGTPKSSILIGFSIINNPFWGALFLETPISSLSLFVGGCMRWVAISLEKFETSETALRWALNRSLRQYVGTVPCTHQLGYIYTIYFIQRFVFFLNLQGEK